MEALRPAAPLSGRPPPCGQGGVRLRCGVPASSPGAGASIPVYRPRNPGVLGLLAVPQATWLLCDSTESWSPAPSRPSLGWGPRSAAALFPELPVGPGQLCPARAFQTGLPRAGGVGGGQEDESARRGRGQPCSAHLQAGVTWATPLFLSLLIQRRGESTCSSTCSGLGPRAGGLFPRAQPPQ